METISIPQNLEPLTNNEIQQITRQLIFELNRIKDHLVSRQHTELRQEQENQRSITIHESEICHCPHSIRRMHPLWDCPYKEDRPLQICHTLAQQEEEEDENGYENQGYTNGYESDSQEESDENYQPEYSGEEDYRPQTLHLHETYDPEDEECHNDCGKDYRHSLRECPENNHSYDEDSEDNY